MIQNKYFFIHIHDLPRCNLSALSFTVLLEGEVFSVFILMGCGQKWFFSHMGEGSVGVVSVGY